MIKSLRIAVIAATLAAASCFKADSPPTSKPRPASSASPTASSTGTPVAEPKSGGYDQALLDFRSKNLDKAEAGFKEVVAAEPKNADAHFYLGKIRAERRDHEGSVRHLREAVKLDPDSVEKLMALGDAYFELKKFDTAIVEYGKVPGFEPNNAQAYYKLGRTYVALGNEIAARQQLRKLEPLDKALGAKLAQEIGN
jgi:tetratricopeptide (TPR) repeat protein